MLNVVAKRLQQEYPKVPLFTVHDSIMTVPEHAALVTRFMQEQITRCVGFTPTLRSKDLVPVKAACFRKVE